MTRLQPTPPAAHFDRGAWLTLVFALALLLFGLTLFVYRLTLPTDGWISEEPEGFDSYGFIYTQNVLGLPSGLQVGDHLIAVEGISLDTTDLNTALFDLRPIWQAGSSVRYTLLRAGGALDIDVPLAHWALSSLTKSSAVENLTLLASFGLFLGVGFVTFLKRPEIPAARALLVLGAVWLSVALALSPNPLSIHDTIFPFTSIGLAILISAAFTVLIPPAFIRFGLVFPRPKLLLERRPWIAFLPYGVGVIGIFAFLNGFFVFGWVWTAASVLISILLILHSALTLRDAVSRAQLRWGLGGMLLGLGMFLFSFLPIFFPLSEPVANLIDYGSGLGIWVMGLTLGIAILRYRLFDIDLILRRTLAYGALTLTLGLVYFGSVVLLQELSQGITGQGQSPLVIVVSTLLIAALFNPLRRRIQHDIDRRFFRGKYDAEKALQSFALRASEEADLDSLTAELLHIVNETLQPADLRLWLRTDSGKRKTLSGIERI